MNTNNLVTKSYLKDELRQLERRRDKQLDKKLHRLKTDLQVEIRGTATQLKDDIISEIKDDNTKTRTEILGAVADFGKRVQDLESAVAINTHNISQLQNLS